MSQGQGGRAEAVGDGDPFAHLPAAPLWRRGKHTLALDLDSADGLTSLHALCAGADVLICNWLV